MKKHSKFFLFNLIALVTICFIPIVSAAEDSSPPGVEAVAITHDFMAIDLQPIVTRVYVHSQMQDHDPILTLTSTLHDQALVADITAWLRDYPDPLLVLEGLAKRPLLPDFEREFSFMIDQLDLFAERYNDNPHYRELKALLKTKILEEAMNRC